MRLYDLATNYRNIAELADDPTIPMEAVSEALAVIEGDLQAKSQNVVVILQAMEGDIVTIKAEEKRLADRRRAIENRYDGLKEYIKEAMGTAGLQKIKTATFTVSIQNNPPKVEIYDEKIIPAKYLTIIPQTTVPNKKDIAAAIKSGEEVPGASITHGTRLQIR